jgi:hypothetical protein
MKNCAPSWHEALVEGKMHKHTILGALLEDEMFKNCMPLWPEANFEVKSVKKMMGLKHLWAFRCRFAWPA